MHRRSHVPAVFGFCSLVFLWVHVFLPSLVAQERFRRGDVNLDGRVTITDPVQHLHSAFGLSTLMLGCLDAADANGDGFVDAIPDALYTITYLVGLGGEPPPPGPFVCGFDPTPDALDCISASAECDGAAGAGAVNEPTIELFFSAEKEADPPDCPPSCGCIVIEGDSGMTVSKDIFVKMKIPDEGLQGVPGWQLSVAMEAGGAGGAEGGGGNVVLGDATFDETDAFELLADTQNLRSATEESGSVDSAAALFTSADAKLDPGTTPSILKFTVEAEIPPKPEEEEFVLEFATPTNGRLEVSFMEGSNGGGGSMGLKGVAPVTHRTRIICRVASNENVAVVPVLIKPGDANGDGVLDGSDPVAFLSWFFAGVDFPAPAGHELCLATPREGATDIMTGVGLQVLDWSNDGTLDLSDGVGQLAWTFSGGPEHPDCIPTVLSPPNCPNCIAICPLTPNPCIDTCTED